MKLKAGYQCSNSNMGTGGYQQHSGTSIIAATSDISQEGWLSYTYAIADSHKFTCI